LLPYYMGATGRYYRELEQNGQEEFI